MALTGNATGQRVRDVAISLFAERGFHGTGIRDLAGAAELSSASLYHHMGTKEQLLAGIMRTALTRLTSAARQAVSDVDDPVERLGRLIVLHVLTHALRPAETRVVDNEVAALSAPEREAVVRLRDGYEKLFDSTIAYGIHCGVFNTAEPALARLALLEMCNGVARWYSPHGTLDTTELAEHFARIGLRVVEANSPERPDIEFCRSVVTRVWQEV